MPTRKNLVAGILIGGASRRMGRPKALIEIEGLTLLERTVQIARSLADRVVLLGQPPFVIPSAISHLLCLSDRPGGVGPIGGLSALLEYAGRNPALLLACDLPFLKADVIERIIGYISSEFDGFAYCKCPHPLEWDPCSAIYMPMALAKVADSIRLREYSLQRLIETLRIRLLTPTPDERRQLTNFNRPADATICSTHLHLQ